MNDWSEFIKQQKGVINQKVEACKKGIADNPGTGDEQVARQRFKVELGALEDAIIRIEQGKYSLCGCGKTISRGRLIAMPTANTCMECNGR